MPRPTSIEGVTTKSFPNLQASDGGVLLDTNVAIHLRDGDPLITQKVAALEGAVLISIVTRVELEGRVYRKSAHTPIRRARLESGISA